MSTRENNKKFVKQLRGLLRALIRDHAVLVGRLKDGQLEVRVQQQGQATCVLQPSAQLVERAIGEDLLHKKPSGWVISKAGRMALRRMLAGAEPFAAQHQQRKRGRREVDGAVQGVLVNDCSTPLGWLARRKDASGEPLISKNAFAAGERLARDFQFAGMVSRVTSNWAAPGTGGQRRSAPGDGAEISDNRLAARQRVRNAIAQVGPELGGLLLDICCYHIGLGAIEKKRNWPRRSGKVILQIALDRLADHYGMKPRPAQKEGASRISHWGDEGYKPS
ncbi:MAG: DUF6456 domain-containing protein [Hyphomicrobiaceae bacterium]|nr:DUF6456 domain-containing protein [Hyphomicrobiaceae bacterium]